MEKLDNRIAEKSTYILFGIIVLGSVLRLCKLDYQSLWLDELYSIIPTNPVNSLSTVLNLTKGDQPPLFFIYIHYFFKLFGYSGFVGRVACAIIGVTAIPVMYFLGKECENKQVGLMAALLTAINYFHIYHSQELRFYGLVFLLSALSYLFFIRAYKHERPIDFIGYVLATTGLLYTHYCGLILVLTQGITFILFLIYQRNLKFIIAAILSGITILLAFTPWLPIIFSDLGLDIGWLKKPSPYFFAQYFYYYIGKDAITLVIFIVFIFLFAKAFRHKDSKKNGSNTIYVIITLWVTLTYFIPYIRSIFVSPMLVVRYTIITLPAIIILLAIGWNEIKINKYKYTLVIVLGLASISNLLFFRHYYTRPEKSQFREASLTVQSNNSSNLPVYSSFAWHFNFYFQNSTDTVKNIDLLYSTDSSVEQFWLLQAHSTYEEFEIETKKLSETFQIVDKHSFFEANAILLKRKEE